MGVTPTGLVEAKGESEPASMQALILFIQTLALYKSFTYLLTLYEGDNRQMHVPSTVVTL